MVLCLVAIGVVQITWYWAVMHLYALPIEAIAAFTSITNSSFYVNGAIVIFMISGKLVYEWKMNTAQTIAEEGKQVVQEFKIDPKFKTEDLLERYGDR